MKERTIGKKGPEKKTGSEKVFDSLKKQYSGIVESIASGRKTPVEPIMQLKQGAFEDLPLFYTENGERVQLSREFCLVVYDELINAMFESGDMEGLGRLGEDHLLAIAAAQHKNKEYAIKAAKIITSRKTITSDDLNIIAETKYQEVKDMINRARLEVDEWPK